MRKRLYAYMQARLIKLIKRGNGEPTKSPMFNKYSLNEKTYHVCLTLISFNVFRSSYYKKTSKCGN